MRLRTNLLLLVVATTLPLVVFAVLVSVLLISHEKDNFVRVVQDRNRALMSAVEAEVKGHVATLNALATLPSIANDDLPQVYRDLTAAVATQPDWINVALNDTSGQQLVNTVMPFGSPLPATNDPDSSRQVGESVSAVVGNLSYGKLVGRFLILVRVPVVRDGRLAYVLTAGVKPEAFETLIRRQQIPDGWVSGLVDGNGRFIARVPSRPVGSLASEQFRTAVARAAEGWERMSTIEGFDGFTAHIKSELTGWSLGVAVPASVVLGGSHRAAWTLGGGVAAAITLGIAIAIGLGRRISTPIADLAAAAPTLGSATITGVATGINEVNDLATALQRASDAIRERERAASSERDALEAADRAKDEFLAMLSHELRNPLAALSASAAILKLRKGGEISSSAVGVIDRQTRQMARLVDDLLDVSSIVMGKSALDLHVLDLGELVPRLVQTWRDANRLSAHDVSVRVEPVWVRADRARVEQVVSNLLDNALKFTPAGKRIVVDVRDEAGEARIAVADEGSGIAAADIDRMFGLFEQGPQDLSRRFGGLGIGLALVKRLVEMHGGRVTAQSGGPGHGSTFTVALPACEPLHATRPATITPIMPSSSHERVLVVEDNDDTRDALVSLLSLLGYGVDEAPNGATAVRRATELLPDIVLIDIGLPDIDGYEVARRLRALPAGSALTLIALTGYGQPDDRKRALQAGFDDHLTKPATADDMQSLFQRVGATRSPPRGVADRPAA